MKKTILMAACILIMGAAFAQTNTTEKSTVNTTAAQTLDKKQERKAKTQRRVAMKQKRQAENSLQADKGRPGAASRDLKVAKKKYRRDKAAKNKDMRNLKKGNKTSPIVKPDSNTTSGQ